MSSHPLRIEQRFDESTTVSARGIATYRHASVRDPKPCLHPLVTQAGHRLTGFEMSDHVWHRGLWFTIKFINGSNFWEERQPFGIQRGTSEPRVELRSPSEALLRHDLVWESAATGPVVREQRTLRFQSFDGFEAIDWTSQIDALADLTLDRTPYTTWGGYSGLTFRGSREMHNGTFLLPDGQTTKTLVGDRHDWTVLQAAMDGGVEQRVSVGIIDHPSNPRSQSPWYGKSNDDYMFLNAAFLFHEPMTVSKGESLKFRYRVCYRGGLWTAEQFAAVASAFRESQQDPL